MLNHYVNSALNRLGRGSRAWELADSTLTLKRRFVTLRRPKELRVGIVLTKVAAGMIH